MKITYLKELNIDEFIVYSDRMYKAKEFKIYPYINENRLKLMYNYYIKKI